MPAHDESSQRMTRALWLALAAILLVHFVARVQNVGHLLTWDEAMNIRTVVSHVEGANDQYAVWFSRHPPMMATMLAWLAPLERGFIHRAEVLAIAISCCVLLALFAVVKKTFGPRTALFAAACYAVMPGAVFYDTWIKQDGLVALFGLIAILFWLQRRALMAGIFLGVCCLAKENAIYFAAALFLLWLFERPWNWRNLAAIAIAPALVAGWWYALFSTAIADQFSFATGVQITKVEQWDKPLLYFFQKLPLDLGWPGLVLAIIGLVVCGADRRSARADGAVCTTAGIWPLALIVPGYAILTLMHGKAPWLNIALLPALAIAQGVACDWMLTRLVKNLSAIITGLITGVAPVLLAMIALDFIIKTDYEKFMQRQDYGTWRGANASRAAALELKSRLRPGQRVLVTPMWYWTDVQQGICPIFTCYLGNPFSPEILHLVYGPTTMTAEKFVKTVREKNIAWAMLAPPPGDGEKQLLQPLIRAYHLKPIIPDGQMNCLFDVRPLR